MQWVKEGRRRRKQKTEEKVPQLLAMSMTNQYIKDLCENFDQLLELWLNVVAEPTTVLSPHGHPKI